MLGIFKIIGPIDVIYIMIGPIVGNLNNLWSHCQFILLFLVSLSGPNIIKPNLRRFEFLARWTAQRLEVGYSSS